MALSKQYAELSQGHCRVTTYPDGISATLEVENMTADDAMKVAYMMMTAAYAIKEEAEAHAVPYGSTTGGTHE